MLFRSADHTSFSHRNCSYRESYYYRNPMSRGKRLVIGIVRQADRHNVYVPTVTAENAQSVIGRLPRKPSGLVEASLCYYTPTMAKKATAGVVAAVPAAK